MTEWQPIATAPACYHQSFGELEWITFIGFYKKSLFSHEWKTTRPYEPTHWLPLPPPPKEIK